MAYYLSIEPSTVDSRVELNSTITPPSDFNLEFEIDITASAAVLFTKLGSGSDLLFFTDLNTLQIRINSVQNNITLNQSAAGRHKYNIVKTGSAIELFQDDVSCGSIASANFYSFQALLSFNNNTSRAFNFYYAKLSDGAGTVLHDWNKQTLVGSNDTLLPDTVAGNNGTLIEFPTDNSQWVFYSDSAGVSANASFTVSAPTVAASTSATLPNFSASVSFTVSVPNVSSSASVTLPNPTANVGYTVSTPTLSVNADASLPQPTSDLAFTVSAPAVTAIAAATEPNFNAEVNFTVNAPTFAVDASATLPQPDSSVNFALSAPSVSVVAIVGGIAIIVDDETNINQRVLSTNINAPILSTNING